MRRQNGYSYTFTEVGFLFYFPHYKNIWVRRTGLWYIAVSLPFFGIPKGVAVWVWTVGIHSHSVANPPRRIPSWFQTEVIKPSLRGSQSWPHNGNVRDTKPDQFHRGNVCCAFPTVSAHFVKGQMYIGTYQICCDELRFFFSKVMMSGSSPSGLGISSSMPIQ